MDSDSGLPPIYTREYGKSGPHVVLLHGGPGAAGYMAPIARELADTFRVLEPFQRRGSDNEPVNVARHVEDLHQIVARRCGRDRPAIVGHSWGAMLALAYAAGHPQRARCLVLIGCGTFDRHARDHLRKICRERIGPELKSRIGRLIDEYPDPDERLKMMGRLILPVYSHDLIAADDETEIYDAGAHEQTWADMVHLQETGVYPAAFAKIDAPAIMLHGADDPHPGPLILAALKPHLPQLQYRQWDRCGHYPWLEKAVQREFYAALRQWLTGQFT